jgi:D-alanine-D-alanine ligase
MEKVFTKQVFVMRGIPTPKHVIYSTADEALEQNLPFPYPVVVKPSREGSSVGVAIAKDAVQYRDAVKDAGKYAGLIMVEQFIKGREVQGAVLDDEALGVIEIVPAREFYDYQAKYGPNSGTQYIFPARLDPEIYDRVNQICLQAHVALGCSGATRSDAIVTDNGEIYLLEVNTLPGMTATSLLPKIAAGKGISFTQLCERLLQGASLKA